MIEDDLGGIPAVPAIGVQRCAVVEVQRSAIIQAKTIIAATSTIVSPLAFSHRRIRRRALRALGAEVP